MNPKSAIVVFAVFLILCGAIAIGSSESEANKTGSSTDSGTGSSSGTGNDSSATEDTEITSASGDCGTTTALWSYDIEDNKLTISGSGAVKAYSTTGTGSWDVDKVTYGSNQAQDAKSETLKDIFTKTGISLTVTGSVTIDASAFANLSIGSVSFGSGYTSVGASAFKNCKSLTSANLSSITSIGTEAFSGCTSLTTLTFNSSTTSTTNTYICTQAFSGCTALKSVDIRK